jgi:hypothetical protein
MDEEEALRRCHVIVAEAGQETQGSIRLTNLLDYLDLTAECIKAWPKKRRNNDPNLKDLLETLSRLKDDAQRIVERDPIILYKPQHAVALAFHQSLAKYRYFFGANRISKTIAGYVDDAWIATGRHPFRRKGLQGSVFVIGSDYEKYAPMVFETKLIRGENGNPLSPIFPEKGKWLHHYDSKRHILYIACMRCAHENRAQSCNHVKYTISLFSDKGDSLSLAGGQYAQGHLDEPVVESMWNEGQQRITTVVDSGMIVTETPGEHGKGWWSYQVLYKLGIKGKPENWLPERGIPVVSLHQIDRLSAGLTPKEDIIAMMKTMPENEIRARILGEHVSANEVGIFDFASLDDMAKQTVEPVRGDLLLSGEEKGKSIEEISRHIYDEGCSLFFSESIDGNLRVYEPPKFGEQYVIGGDVASGLTRGDPSAAIVHKMIPVGEQMALEHVASYHGWVGVIPYADALFRLGLYYNCATLIVESNGPGLAVIQRLFDTLGCWFLFRDVNSPAAATQDLASTYGINTNVRSKPMMIAVLQSKIRAHMQGMPSVLLKGKEEIEEHHSFIQEANATGTGFKMKGAGKSRDDFVMANAIAVYGAVAHPLYNYQLDAQPKKEVKLSEQEKSIWASVKIRALEDERGWY